MCLHVSQHMNQEFIRYPHNIVTVQVLKQDPPIITVFNGDTNIG